ncbi:MAG TPA: NfeD family protein [Opitutaceae bacterium]|nr:NfeD family protein [Opitutaceae bacterium]
MNLIALLFVLGLVFLFFEVFTPGPIFGILGGFTLLAGIAVAAVNYGARGGLFAGAAALAAVVATLYAELVWLPKTRFAQRFSVRSTSGTTIRQLPKEAESVVGKTAETATTLAPSGYVLVEGKRYEAFCQSGHVERGTQVRVTGLDNFRLIVTKT